MNQKPINLELKNLTPEQEKILTDFTNKRPELTPNLFRIIKKLQEIIDSNDLQAWEQFFITYKEDMEKK